MSTSLAAGFLCSQAESTAVHLSATPNRTVSVFINDDEYGLHQDYGKWLEELAPHAPIRQYQHNRTGEACPERSRGNNASAHLIEAARTWPGEKA